MGNSLLQSGAAFGAILIPEIIRLLVDEPGTWPYPFFVVGAAGTVWVIVWLLSVRAEDLALPSTATLAPSHNGDAVERPGWWLANVVTDLRFWVLVILVVGINQTWHFYRVWLPLCLREYFHYAKDDVLHFSTGYYVAADVGSISAGVATLWLARRGLSVHASRRLVFLGCSLLTTLSVVTAFLPASPLLLALFLIIGFGSLGLFPVYYSLSQELTVRHQGKVTGVLSFTTWMASAAAHPLVGRWIDQTADWPAVLSVAGLPPSIGFVVLLFVWRAPRSRGIVTDAPEPQAKEDRPAVDADAAAGEGRA
jgi:ACS family hexuronate transporter-like MFS transporter